MVEWNGEFIRNLYPVKHLFCGCFCLEPEVVEHQFVVCLLQFLLVNKEYPDENLMTAYVPISIRDLSSNFVNERLSGIMFQFLL